MRRTTPSARRLLLGPALALALMVLPGAPIPAVAADGSSVLVTGRVDLSPTCPVQRPEEDCTTRGVPALVTARRGGATETARSRASGFRLRLGPGVWRLTADAGMGCPTIRITVRAGHPRRGIVIECDTGIR